MEFIKAGFGLNNFFEKLQSSNSERTYILPTAFGVLFGVVALLMLLFAIGSGNNFIYLYTFFAAAVAQTAMVLTNNNIRGLKIEIPDEQIIFANSEQTLEVLVRNTGKKPSQELNVVTESGLSSSIKSLHPLSRQIVGLKVFYAERGFRECPRVTLQSTFPFLMLRSWKSSPRGRELYVFPEPRGVQELPAMRGVPRSGVSGDVFRGHREYQSTDSIRRVDWRVTARLNSLYVKDYETQEQQQLVFSPDQVDHLVNPEDKLSQMTLWFKICEEKKIPYGFQRSPESAYHIGLGTAHLRAHLQEIVKCWSRS